MEFSVLLLVSVVCRSVCYKLFGENIKIFRVSSKWISTHKVHPIIFCILLFSIFHDKRFLVSSFAFLRDEFLARDLEILVLVWSSRTSISINKFWGHQWNLYKFFPSKKLQLFSPCSESALFPPWFPIRFPNPEIQSVSFWMFSIKAYVKLASSCREDKYLLL